MNKQIVKFGLLVFLVGCITFNADAQRRGRTRNQPTNQPTTNQPDTIPSQVTNINQPSTYNPYGNTPIEMAPQVGGFTDSVKKSLRNDAAFEKNFMKERTPLDYEYLRWDDALFTERVWREIDVREKINSVFRYNAEDDNGDQRFVNIIVKAVRSGKVTPFDPVDDRFTTPLDSAAFEKALSGGGQCDTLPVFNLQDPTLIDKYVINCATLNPDEIVKFRIKEDWVFDRESSRLFCRIIGIAPLKTVVGIDKKTELGTTPLFWIYYPDIRSTLTKYEVYNPKNMGQSRMTWEELFESRMFNSYIVKSTMDNPLNKMIRQLYPGEQNGILRLLEGENLKEKIFNYEQDLWSY